MSALSIDKIALAILLLSSMAAAQESITFESWRRGFTTEVRQQLREDKTGFFRLVLYSDTYRDERLRELSTLSENERYFAWRLQQNFIADLMVRLDRPETIEVVADYFGGNQQESPDEISDEEIRSMIRPLMMPCDRSTDPNTVESLFDVEIDRTTSDRITAIIREKGCRASAYIFEKRKGLIGEFWVPDPLLSRSGIQ